MEAKNVEDAVCLPHADVPVAVAVPVEDGELIAATSAESADTGRNMALEITGWISLMVNAAAVVSMSLFLSQNGVFGYFWISFGDLAELFLTYGPFLALWGGCVLSVIFIWSILYGGFRGTRGRGHVRGRVFVVSKKQWWCLLLASIALFILPLPVSSYSMVTFISFIGTRSISIFTSLYGFFILMCAAVSPSFAAFVVVLFTRLQTHG